RHERRALRVVHRAEQHHQQHQREEVTETRRQNVDAVARDRDRSGLTLDSRHDPGIDAILRPAQGMQYELENEPEAHRRLRDYGIATSARISSAVIDAPSRSAAATSRW